jgi:hypothetical protein
MATLSQLMDIVSRGEPAAAPSWLDTARRIDELDWDGIAGARTNSWQPE